MKMVLKITHTGSIAPNKRILPLKKVWELQDSEETTCAKLPVMKNLP